MTVQSTQAAKQLKESEPDPHQLISLLMAGTLERIEQAKMAVEQKNEQEKYLLVEKIVAIINGLKGSLNFNQGGEIAQNLDALYTYMLDRIFSADGDKDELSALSEVAKLMAQVKSGWDGVEPAEAA